MAAGSPEDDPVGDAHGRLAPGMPRWVKAGIVVIVGVILLIVILTLTGVHQAGHGP